MIPQGMSPGLPAGSEPGVNCCPTGLLPPHGRGRGMREGMSVRGGFSLARTDVLYERETEARLQSPGDFLRIHFKLAGESAIADDRMDLTPIEAGRIFFVVQPPGGLKVERVRVDSREQSVTLIRDREFAGEMIPLGDDLPTSIRDFLRGRSSHMTIESLPMPVRLRPIIEDILEPKLSGHIGQLMLEARAVELLCLTVHQILKVPSGAERIRDRDRQRVRDLCAFIESDLAANCSNAQLSRRVAWNESQMMECFKAVTGSTISNYRQEMRMRRAHRQLRETDLPITEIAFDAGYEHPSNFATAFKRAFGCSPRTVRQH